MGVRGLTALLETHRRIYREVELRRRRLVIDGNNLLFPLYLLSGLDQNHGGDYAAFEEEIEAFVDALRRCEIRPYVVMDGGTDPTGRKLDTLRRRAVERIGRSHRAAAEGTSRGVLPQCGKMVFVQTLQRLGVPLAQCYGEADEEIAALASEWRCPVLSNDSDFFLLQVPGGVLPINHFQWRALRRSGAGCCVPCKSYTMSRLCAAFDIRPQLLPAFATLAGNDYFQLERTESPRWAQFDLMGGENRLRGLLHWVRGFPTPREALEAALGLMGNLSVHRKAEVLRRLTLGMEMYQLPPPSSLMGFFVQGRVPQRPAAEGVVARVPDWMWCPLMQARLPGDVLDVLQLHRRSLSMPVDHGDMPSAHLTSRPLRQLMYGLLLGRDTGLQVEEWDRDGLQLKLVPVQPDATSVPRGLELHSLDKVELSQRLQVILQALKVTEASLSRLPPPLRLPVAVTCFWLEGAEPAPDKALLKSLLLWLSDGDALRHGAVLQPEGHPQELDMNVAHALNQWHVCLKDSVQLNRLLGCPLPDGPIARWYEGTVVHRLVHRMRTIGGLRDFPERDPSNVRLYESMLSVVRRSRSPEASLRQLSVHGEDQQAETESFTRAQEDPSLGDVLVLRTRFKTKERVNRSRNPELNRKEESRGRDLL